MSLSEIIQKEIEIKDFNSTIQVLLLFFPSGSRRHIRFFRRLSLSMADVGVVETILLRLEKVDGGVDSQDVATSLGVDHQVIVGAVKSLQALGDVSLPSCAYMSVSAHKCSSFSEIWLRGN